MVETSDLYFAAFLRAKGIALEDYERINGRIVFRFEASPHDWNHLQKEYWQSDSPNVNVARYGAELRQLKVLLHSLGARPKAVVCV